MESGHHSPSPSIYLSLEAPQIYEQPRGMSPHICAYASVVDLSLRGGRVHISLFVLATIQTHSSAALPSLIRGPHSISAMSALEGRSALIFL